jgi:hypothetical protein
LDTFLVFFFFADLESDLTAGFWVVEAAIMRVGESLGTSEERRAGIVQ